MRVRGWLLLMMGYVALGFPMRAQTAVPDSLKVFHAAGPMPSYEVATIKKPDASGGGQMSPGFIAGVAAARAASVPLRNSSAVLVPMIRRYIQAAYGIPRGSEMRVVGGPAWIDSDAYVIQGKVPDELRDAMQKMTPAEQANEIRKMQQMLLQERFKLKLHFETRELPVYELVVAKGGPKLKPAEVIAPNQHAPVVRFTIPDNGASAQKMEMTQKSETLDQLAVGLPNLAKDIGERTIVNKTGLDGKYAFTLSWTNQAAAAPENDAPSIFTALEEQLGLKLVPGREQVEVVVIDSIERPTEN